MTHYLEKLANDREIAESASIKDQLRFLGKRLGLFKNEAINDPIGAAQTALASRAADEFCALTDKLIEINALKGKGVRKELLLRMQSDWTVKSSVPLTPVAVAGAVSTGAASGLVTDIATGGLSLGIGTLLGTVAGALGGVGLAVAYNQKKEINGTVVTWSDNALNKFLLETALLYLAIAHFGRGRGNWQDGEYPKYWTKSLEQKINNNNLSTKKLWQKLEILILNTIRERYIDAKI